MVETIRPEEVIRTPVNPTDESLTERDLQIVEGSLNILIEDYSRVIPFIERNSESWQKASRALMERYELRKKEIMSLPVNDQVKELLLDLNLVLGRMIDYVNSQAQYLEWCLVNNALDGKFSEKRKDIENALAVKKDEPKRISFDEIAIKFASYQTSLLNTLYSLGEKEVKYGAKKERFSVVIARLLKGLLEKGIG